MECFEDPLSSLSFSMSLNPCLFFSMFSSSMWEFRGTPSSFLSSWLWSHIQWICHHFSLRLTHKIELCLFSSDYLSHILPTSGPSLQHLDHIWSHFCTLSPQLCALLPCADLEARPFATGPPVRPPQYLGHSLPPSERCLAHSTCSMNAWSMELPCTDPHFCLICKPLEFFPFNTLLILRYLLTTELVLNKNIWRWKFFWKKRFIGPYSRHEKDESPGVCSLNQQQQDRWRKQTCPHFWRWQALV